jgi:hypothetical protein
VVRFQLVARPYEIKAWGEGVDEWWVGSSLTSDVGGSMLFQRTGEEVMIFGDFLDV